MYIYIYLFVYKIVSVSSIQAIANHYQLPSYPLRRTIGRTHVLGIHGDLVYFMFLFCNNLDPTLVYVWAMGKLIHRCARATADGLNHPETAELASLGAWCVSTPTIVTGTCCEINDVTGMQL